MKLRPFEQGDRFAVVGRNALQIYSGVDNQFPLVHFAGQVPEGPSHILQCDRHECAGGFGFEDQYGAVQADQSLLEEIIALFELLQVPSRLKQAMGKNAYPLKAMAEECLAGGWITHPHPSEELP